MWFTLSIYIFISILIILIGHSLFYYFKDKYTNKKTKDLVSFHTQKYRTIIQETQDALEKSRHQEQNQQKQQQQENQTLPVHYTIHENENISLDDDLAQYVMSLTGEQ